MWILKHSRIKLCERADHRNWPPKRPIGAHIESCWSACFLKSTTRHRGGCNLGSNRTLIHFPHCKRQSETETGYNNMWDIVADHQHFFKAQKDLNFFDIMLHWCRAQDYSNEWVTFSWLSSNWTLTVENLRGTVVSTQRSAEIVER